MENDEKNFLIIGIAALFRGCRMIKGEDTAKYNNTEVIKEATEFVNACESHGLLPKAEK